MERTNGQKIWDEFFKDKKVAAFGIGSDRTQHLLYRLQNGNLNGIQPKAIVLMIGTNNTASDHSAYDIYLGTKAIIETIQKLSPKSKVFLYNTFPRIRATNTRKPAWANNERANKLCDQLCDGKRVLRASISKKLLDENGQPNKKIFFDGIHLNEIGYRIWAKDIIKNLKKQGIEL